ncbi:hypothetical protein Tco_0702530 [Tanacetum coccineum]|uniref:Uncharacterized protein n=1 Tax=Tanacetum coccineum TaxID=301880 RepID=A0ABQ4XWI1_9ASTR
MRSPRVRRQRERVVRFEEAPNREGGRIESNVEGGGPSKLKVRENRSRGMNLPLLLAAHLLRNKNGQPLQSSLTFIYGGHQPLNNTGGNLPPKDTHLSHHAQPFIPSSLHPSNGFIPAHIEDYPLPEGLKMPSRIGSYDGKGDPDNYFHLFEGAIRMQK